MSNEPKIILAAGTLRSGSTWMFNAIRLVLQESKRTFVSGWIDDLELDACTADYVLVKLHAPSESLREMAWKIFTIHRDLRDLARSCVDFLKIETTSEVMEQVGIAVAHHSYWKACADRDYRYELIAKQPDQLVADIAKALEVAPETIDIRRIVDQLSKMQEPKDSDKYDSVSLLHPAHRFGGQEGGWKERLNPEVAPLIMEKFGDWMVEHDYR